MTSGMNDQWVGVTERVEILKDAERTGADLSPRDFDLMAFYDDAAALLEGIEKIIQWSEAYPLDVFPEPDFKKARKLLKDGGMTIDGISASNMRHVITEVAKIAKAALPEHSR